MGNAVWRPDLAVRVFEIVAQTIEDAKLTRRQLDYFDDPQCERLYKEVCEKVKEIDYLLEGWGDSDIAQVCRELCYGYRKSKRNFT